MSLQAKEVICQVFVSDEPAGLAQHGVGLVMRGSPLIEFEGDAVPGVSMTPAQARELAEALLESADEAEADS